MQKNIRLAHLFAHFRRWKRAKKMNRSFNSQLETSKGQRLKIAAMSDNVVVATNSQVQQPPNGGNCVFITLLPLQSPHTQNPYRPSSRTIIPTHSAHSWIKNSRVDGGRNELVHFFKRTAT